MSVDTKELRERAMAWPSKAQGAFVITLADEVDRLRGVTRADDERLEMAAKRVWGEHRWGCDTAEHLADEVDQLREDYAKIVHANAEVGSLNVGLQLEVDRLWKPLLAAAKSIREGSGDWETFYDAIAACEEKP